MCIPTTELSDMTRDCDDNFVRNCTKSRFDPNIRFIIKQHLGGIVVEPPPRVREARPGHTKYLNIGSKDTLIGTQSCGVGLRRTSWYQDEGTRGTGNLLRKCQDLTENIDVSGVKPQTTNRSLSIKRS